MWFVYVKDENGEWFKNQFDSERFGRMFAQLMAEQIFTVGFLKEVDNELISIPFQA